MSKVEISHIPTVIRYEITRYALGQIVNSLPVNWQSVDLTDNYYFYVSWEDWGKVIEYVQRSLPKYVYDTFDCENFADYIRIQTALKFGVNTCASVEGLAVIGGQWARHGWNIFFDGEGFYQLESQIAMDIKEIDDNYYKPDKIILG